MKTFHRPLFILGVTLVTLFSARAQAETLSPEKKHALRQQMEELKLQLAAPAVTTKTGTFSYVSSKSTPPVSGNPVAAQLAEAVKEDKKDDLEGTLLRKYGFAVNLGYGYFPDLKDYAPDIQLRYNFFQRLQTADAIDSEIAKKLAITRSKEFWGGTLTDFSGWIGYPLQKMENRDRTLGNKQVALAGTVKESPLMVGLGVGLGGGPEFSSAVSLNVGVALFKNEAFKRNQLYVGVSVDAVLFQTITKALASATNTGK